MIESFDKSVQENIKDAISGLKKVSKKNILVPTEALAVVITELPGIQCQSNFS